MPTALHHGFLPANASRAWAWALLAALILVAMPLAVPAQGDDRPRMNATLGAGDNIRITVFQNPDLTTEARLSPLGEIVFPMIGEVALGGLTQAEAGARIAQLLRNGKFILRPQVSVAMLEARSRVVHVLGQLSRPGNYALEDGGSRLTDILTQAGGISPSGADVVTVLSSRGGKLMKREIDVLSIFRGADPATNIQISSGDTIFVQRAPVFYIYGEVQRAGAYRLEPNMIVMQALSLGVGLTVREIAEGPGRYSVEKPGFPSVYSASFNVCHRVNLQ